MGLLRKLLHCYSMRGVVVLSLLVALFLHPGFLHAASDQLKSIEFLVGVSDGSLSGQTNFPFTIYIGDNINTVTDPVKSVFFTISGVYTGSGTVQLQLDSQAGTAKTFNLPVVAAPTPFEFIYKDTSNYINPTSAGNYSYTLNVIPTGVTISGFGAKLNVTYRYAPVSCDDGQPSNEKVKTLTNLVGVSESPVSSQLNLPFSLYLGDNLTGVADPVKSVFFTISGVYTGSGTVQLQLDSQAGTAKTFNLPVVAAPTPFEFIYKDTSNYINPTSAGNYSYTLNVIPTGVTISGFGATVTTTYRYKPPSCGLPPTGEVTSVVFDTTGSSDGPAYNSFLWKGTLNSGNGKVRFQLATSDCPNAQTNPPTCTTSGAWNFRGGVTCSSSDWYTTSGPDVPIEAGCSALYHNNQRYFKYKVQLCSASDCTSSGAISPRVDDVVVNWSP